MLVIISPAKKMDFSIPSEKYKYTEPEYKKETGCLLEIMKAKSVGDIKTLMSLSQSLAELNYDRYQNFYDSPAKPALIAFKGDVYSKMAVDLYTEEDFDFAQKHLRILSGLYGILKPLDLIHAYRLEMGTKLKFDGFNNLYGFWKTKITSNINQLIQQRGNILINLASNEYSSVIDMKYLPGSVITITFKNFNKGSYKTIGLLAKRARGLMANFIIKNKITSLSDIKDFSDGGYQFEPSKSSDTEFLFFGK